MPNLMGHYFGSDGRATNRAIVFTDPTSQKPFMVNAVSRCPDMHFVGAAAGTVVLPFETIGSDGRRAENITDWTLQQFCTHYEAMLGKRGGITKETIFYYVYALLHDPKYREKYALNLKRQFPHLPFYRDFWRWADWGKDLLELHIDYMFASPFRLSRVDMPDAIARKQNLAPKPILKVEKSSGKIVLDTETTLAGIPVDAWEYKLGSRSALEWIVDQYREKKPKDPTIREKFNSYRFADHKERVIELISRLTTVSVRTVAIVNSMRTGTR
jgi:predicted helicase